MTTNDENTNSTEVRFVTDSDIRYVIVPRFATNKRSTVDGKSREKQKSSSFAERYLDTDAQTTPKSSKKETLNSGSNTQVTPLRTKKRNFEKVSGSSNVEVQLTPKRPKLLSSVKYCRNNEQIGVLRSDNETNVVFSTGTPNTKISNNLTPSTSKNFNKGKFSGENEETPSSVRSSARRQIWKSKKALDFGELTEKFDSDNQSDVSSDSYDEYVPSDDDSFKVLSDSESSHESCDDEIFKGSYRSFVNESKKLHKKSVTSDAEEDNKYDCDYYFLKKMEKNKTSDHTLSRLKSSKLQQEDLNELLHDYNQKHLRYKKILLNKHKSRFQRLMFYLREGFSILLYGVGSKRTLLDSFRTNCLSNSRVLVVNGFFPDLTMKEIFGSLMVDILKMKASSDLDECVKRIALRMETCAPIFVIIHNIDGIPLRMKKQQTSLAKLASIPNVHLIASFDHINAPMLWSNSLTALFNFLWINATTYETYKMETSFGPSFLTENSTNSIVLSSLLKVFAHLPSNTKKVFQILVKDHLEKKNDRSYQGMLFSDLYAKSREAMVVTSDLVLRTQLTEFLDHKIIKWKKDSNIIHIPIHPTVLDEFYNTQFDKDEEM